MPTEQENIFAKLTAVIDIKLIAFAHCLLSIVQYKVCPFVPTKLYRSIYSCRTFVPHIGSVRVLLRLSSEALTAPPYVKMRGE